MNFWVIAALLVFLGLIFVILPLLRTQKNSNTSRIDVNKAIYQSKVDELRSDLNNNLLDKEEYDNAVEDLQKTLLLDAEGQDQKEFNSGSNKLIVIMLAVILPLSSLFIYKNVSTKKSDEEIAALKSASSQVRTMQDSILNLEQKLKENPDNVDGWRMLGQSYFVIQQYEQSKNAYAKAADLLNQADPEVLVLLAEASAFSNDQLFSNYEESLLNKALSINPKHERGLWYAGYAAYTNNKFQEAVDYWGELLKLVPADRPDVKDSLVKFLNDAREKAGMPKLAESVSESNEADTQRSINVSVQLNESVNEMADSGDTLFVYARAVSGPKMPLSLARYNVSNLPVTVTLTKEMAMMPAMDIDTFEQVEVIARISKSGQAISQPGDLISSGVIVDFAKSNSAEVNLDIDSIVK